MNLGDFQEVKEYTLWGWFKFNGETSAISNVITLRNLEPVGSNDATLGPFPNPNNPVCPITDEEIKLNPSLLNEPGIKGNPNCSTDRVNIKTKGPDYLYINYDLNPP